MNIKVYLQFDGTNYHGWQIQSEKTTVQGTVAKAIEKLTHEKINPCGCGRTDSGVHALGYVCSFQTSATIPADKFAYALNSQLPDDIICTGAEKVEDDFTANRSAKAKTYRYVIDNSKFGNVFLGRYAWHYKYPLDVKLMKKASEAFCGTHDFIGFASSRFSVKTTVRTVYSLDIFKNGDVITIDITGNGFLYNMVRIIVGTLVYVGGGRINAEDIPKIIKSRCRQKAGITAPAKGLCLKEVYY